MNLKMDASLAQVLAFFGTGDHPHRFGLQGVNQALQILGRPQDKMPPCLHICGTNGKGSAAAFVRAVAEQAGLKTHVYSSPHLLRVNERIRLAGKLVSDSTLAQTLQRLAETGVELTWFEALTLAGFVLFSEHPADLCVIETGAGGTLDATNALSRSVLCMVTPISRDHEEMFGVSGVNEIAAVKAGIFRHRIPVVMAAQPPEAEQVLLQQAQRLSAPVLLQNRDWSAELSPDFRFRMKNFSLDCPGLALAGAHQATNAGLAVAALREMERILPLRLQERQIAEALAQAQWPARMQLLQNAALLEQAGMPVVLDGAHNPGAAQALAAEIAGQNGKKVLLLAIGAQKDVRGIIEPLAGLVCTIISCPLPGGGGVQTQELLKLAQSLGVQAIAVESVQEGLQQARLTGADRLYIAGSLYLAASVLEAFAEEVQ